MTRVSELFSDAWHYYRRHPAVFGGLAIIIFILMASFLFPLPYGPKTVDATASLEAPNSRHLFGTDSNGFDVFSRVLAAGRVDLVLALGGSVLAALIGVPIGLIASAKSRTAKWIIRALDVFQGFPLLVLSIVVISLVGNHLSNVIYAILLVNVPQFIRLVRSQSVVVRTRRFVEAAYAIGASPRRVTFRHVLPNVTATIAVQMSLATANALLVISALSYIGVGIKPPTPSWGAMIRTGSEVIAAGKWWVALFPGIMIFLAVLCFNAVARGADSAFQGD